MDKYELMYSSGGHSGPYHGLDQAIRDTKAYIRGQSNPNEKVYIVPRDSRVLNRANDVRVISGLDI